MKTPTASGKVSTKCPARAYSCPGVRRCSRSAHVTFAGSQNHSLQIQAGTAEAIEEEVLTKLR